MAPPRVTADTRVLFDASPLRRFSEASQLGALMLHFTHGGITDIVARELDEAVRLGIRGTDALRALRASTKWPKVYETPPELFREALTIQRSQGSSGEKDLGEITTVLLAQHLGGVVVVAEDALAKNLCRARRIERIPTALVAVDMHIDGVLTEKAGLEVFRISTPPEVDDSRFHQYLRERR